jgi:hypothetical protein
MFEEPVRIVKGVYIREIAEGADATLIRDNMVS